MYSNRNETDQTLEQLNEISGEFMQRVDQLNKLITTPNESIEPREKITNSDESTNNLRPTMQETLRLMYPYSGPITVEYRIVDDLINEELYIILSYPTNCKDLPKKITYIITANTSLQHKQAILERIMIMMENCDDKMIRRINEIVSMFINSHHSEDV